MNAYLLFHSLAEITSATVSISTFLFTWNTRRFQNTYLRTIGTAALFVGLFEVLHCLAFPGMGVFVGYDENLSPQLWLCARLVQGFAGLSGLLLLDRRIRVRSLFWGCAVAFGTLCAVVFLRAAPDVVARPQGLTPIKVSVEWGLVALFLSCAALLYRKRKRLAPVFHLLIAQALVMAVCEVCFTLYLRPYDFENFAGHVLLLLAGALEYLAILRVGLLDPAKTLFRDLSQARERLEQAQTAGRIGTFEWDLQPEGLVHIGGMSVVYGDQTLGTIGSASAWRERIHPEDRDRVDQLLADAIAGRASYDTEYRVTWPDGSVHWVAARGRIQHDVSGRPLRLVGINMDISARKQSEQSLREANAKLEQADRQKNEFIGVLSHELRNPLAPIKNSLFILDGAIGLDDRGRHATRVIGRQVHQLTRLIDDLLDVTRISKGKIRLQELNVDLREIVAGTLEDLGTVLEAHVVSATLPEEPVPVHGDPTRLAQVLANLLGNAAKFTPRGGRIHVRLRAVDDTAVLEVEDAGSGIAPEMLSRLFTPFMQADHTIDRSHGGLGLGLALAKGLVELQRGRIEARSDGLGRGSLFRVELPLEKCGASVATPAQTHAPPSTSGSRRILIIEDNVDALNTLRDVLEIEGHVVATASDGAEGLKIASAFRPEMVLCDIGLPGLDGYAVARALRDKPDGRVLYLVALTGYAQPEDVARARSAGFDTHLPKPPDLHVLKRMIQDYAQSLEEPLLVATLQPGAR
jgi:signal transduction histidine kinase/ActR/RegA family two-component response regulator